MADKSILQHFFLARRLSWPMALSLSLHTSLIAALLYASYHEVRPQPVSRPGPINAIMVNPAMFAMAGAATSARPGASSSTSGEPTAATPPAPPAQRETMPPEQDVRPEKTQVNASPAPTRAAPSAPTRPASVPRATPAVEKPKPQRQERAQRSAAPSVAPAKASPHETQPNPPRPTVSAPQAAALTSAPPSSRAGAMTSADQAPQSGASGGGSPGATANNHAAAPQAISRREPEYPARALALHVEGRVNVSFDVDGEGRVDNVRIVSADPAGVFEREVKRAVRRWRYQAGRPGHDVRVTVYFRIDGRSTIE
ncbi:TonB family protein [Edwardsiella tarda]|uniref:TonB family protein n=1 Tax=Edwardsiella tarda TaxID=636 RepID=UPI00351C965D